MPMLDVDGIEVHYQQAGRGPDVVMVHGLLSSLAFWYLHALPILAREFRVTVYDLRGHGLSEMPGRGYTSAHLASDLHGLADRLGLERFHVVGHSYGGAVALHFALRCPDRVLSLVAADAQVPALTTGLPRPGSVRWRATLEAVRDRGYAIPDDMPRVAFGLAEELARESRDAGARRPPAARLPFNPMSSAQRRWRELMQTTSAARELASSAGLTARRIRGVRCPTLALYGERSFARPTQRELQRNLGDCRSAVIREGGHLFPACAPEAFARAVCEFVGAA